MKKTNSLSEKKRSFWFGALCALFAFICDLFFPVKNFVFHTELVLLFTFVFWSWLGISADRLQIAKFLGITLCVISAMISGYLFYYYCWEVPLKISQYFAIAVFLPFMSLFIYSAFWFKNLYRIQYLNDDHPAGGYWVHG